MKSYLRFDGQGIAYAAVCPVGEYSDNTAFSFQVVGNYSPLEIYNALNKIITARNTNPHDVKDGELNYFSVFTETVGKLDFNYTGSGGVSIVVNKCRVLFHGDAYLLRDFMNKCKRVAEVWENEE